MSLGGLLSILITRVVHVIGNSDANDVLNVFGLENVDELLDIEDALDASIP